MRHLLDPLPSPEDSFWAWLEWGFGSFDRLIILAIILLVGGIAHAIGSVFQRRSEDE